jgi:amidase
MSSGKDWQKLATEKRDGILNAIPKEWRLEKVPSAEEQRDVSGSYIDQYLNAQETEITETDAEGIVKRVGAGEWKAVDVCKAFCHRAAIAHQLV